MKTISEVLSTPVVDQYDVAVCGGGFGGISAALAAGTAAAMTDDFTTLSVKKLQEQLIKDGVVLHTTDIL